MHGFLPTVAKKVPLVGPGIYVYTYIYIMAGLLCLCCPLQYKSRLPRIQKFTAVLDSTNAAASHEGCVSCADLTLVRFAWMLGL